MSLKEFEEFFRENFQAASLVAFRYITDRMLVEDVVQESFVALWEKRSEVYINKDDLKKYLFVTVRNRAISYLRSMKFRQVDSVRSLPEIEQPDHEKLYDDEELAVRISKATLKLPPKCREIFMLAYVENLSYQAVAEHLSITKNTVKTQMVVAYRILRKELKQIYVGLLILLTGKIFTAAKKI